MSFGPIPSAALAADISRQNALEEHRVAPVRRLPWEMLAAICKAAIQDDPFFILTLAHVCGSFRHAVLVSPRLWGTFSINLTNRNLKELVDLFLRRSGSIPLNVTILRAVTPCQTYAEQVNERLVTVMDELHLHQHRLRSLDLCVAGIDAAQAAISVLEGPAPQLQRLRITLDCEQERGTEVLAALKDALQPCPNLRFLELHHCDLPLAFLSTMHEPFINVDSLTLDHLCSPLSHLKANLDLMPNLRSLFCIRWHISMEDLHDPNIHMPFLKNLTVVDQSFGASGLSVLGSLTTPQLQRLTLRSLFNDEFWSDDSHADNDIDYQTALAEVGGTVRNFLWRSGWPRLVELELHGCEMLSEDLVYILRRGDLIESLSLAGRLQDKTFRHLASRPHAKRRPCVPRMHTLVVSEALLKPKIIKKLIEVRNMHTFSDIYRPLQKIKLTNCRGISDADQLRWTFLDPARLTIECFGTDPPSPPPNDSTIDLIHYLQS